MYCTTEEVRGMIKDDALNALIGDRYIEDEEQREERSPPSSKRPLPTHPEKSTGYLVKRYSVPLSRVPKVINKYAKDIAVYNLFSRIGIDEGEKEKNYLNRYNAAIRFLENVAKGIIDIGVSDGSSKAATAFSAQSSPRLFSRASMRGL
ncbi:DUF1320 domain-containing protein [Paenibacillus melissococcoides]|uniref:DUF1320 domain-containing protein n=1 Tax=Paenibacillus melissococcoides TaxID=2912268 RepID=UPI0021C33610|nr:DUF1320 domain-containing protein [Paenibacillus melissococcoides]CAH8721340.1 DUF1320 domain-containing protein [Paenibacillus melissococcoides]